MQMKTVNEVQITEDAEEAACFAASRTPYIVRYSSFPRGPRR